MLNQRREVSRSVTAALVDAEGHIDKALLTHAKLQVAVIEGRRSANLPLDAGQEGLDKLTTAAVHLMAARKAMHEAHYAFRMTRDELRIPVTAYGDFGDTPSSIAPRAAREIEVPALALVHAAA